jgi:hypothetical protein
MFQHLFLIYAPVNRIGILERQFDDDLAFILLLMEENMGRAMSSESQKLFFTRNKNRLVSLDMKKSVIFSSKLTKTPCNHL